MGWSSVSPPPPGSELRPHLGARGREGAAPSRCMTRLQAQCCRGMQKKKVLNASKMSRGRGSEVVSGDAFALTQQRPWAYWGCGFILGNFFLISEINSQ